MALKTLGTNATNTLAALVFSRQMTQADVATLVAAIKDDQNVSHPRWPGALELQRLIIPNRGVLNVLPGDYVAYDSRGWPILLSADTIANGPWTHS